MRINHYKFQINKLTEKMIIWMKINLIFRIKYSNKAIPTITKMKTLKWIKFLNKSIIRLNKFNRMGIKNINLIKAAKVALTVLVETKALAKLAMIIKRISKQVNE